LEGKCCRYSVADRDTGTVDQLVDPDVTHAAACEQLIRGPEDPLADW
jgi:hypothetical protein